MTDLVKHNRRCSANAVSTWCHAQTSIWCRLTHPFLQKFQDSLGDKPRAPGDVRWVSVLWCVAEMQIFSIR